jgi:hypothetical protein
METRILTVCRIDGDYAWLSCGSSQDEPLFIARALLPPEIDEGSRLKYEDFQFEIIK